MRPRLRRGVKREVAASSIIRDVLEAGRAEPLVAALAPLGCRHQAGVATGQQGRKYVLFLIGMVLARGAGEKGFNGCRLALDGFVYADLFDVFRHGRQGGEVGMNLLVTGIQSFKICGNIG